MLAIRLVAPHDRNGNPRRAWVLLENDGSIFAVRDDGYTGWHAVKAEFPDAIEGPSFATTPSEYRELIRSH